MTTEQYFFNYAFPCAQVLLDQRKIDQKAYNELKKLFYAQQCPSRDDLEKIFVSACRRLNIVAKQLGKDPWDLELIKKYFSCEHNNFIDQGEGEYARFGDDFKSVCKVYVAEVIDKKKNILTVKYGDVTRKVLGDIIPQSKVGDKVTIHLGFGIEIL